MDIKEKLKLWGFEELVQGFTENGITLEVLKLCSIDDISSLLLPLTLGSRIRFKRKLEEFQKGILLLEVCSEEPIDVENVLPLASAEYSNPTSPDETPVTFESGATVTSPQENHYNSPKRIGNLSRVSDSPNSDDRICEELERNLKRDAIGREIFSFYEETGYLDTSSRTKLASLVISLELEDDLDKAMSRNRYMQLRDAIVKIFPTEKKETWYIPFCRKDKRQLNERGKLVNCYYTKRTHLIKSGVIRKRHRRTSDSDDSANDTDHSASEMNGTVEKSAVYLKKTEGTRNHHLQEKYVTLDECDENNPPLKQNTGSRSETENLAGNDVEVLSFNKTTTSTITTPSPLTPPRCPKQAGKRKLSPRTEVHPVSRKPGKKMGTRDDLVVFGEYMVSQLRKCSDSRQLAIAKYKIHQILFDMETSSLSNQNSTRLVDSTTSANVSSELSRSYQCYTIEDDSLCDIIKIENN